jgi:hypothetical protein
MSFLWDKIFWKSSEKHVDFLGGGSSSQNERLCLERERLLCGGESILLKRSSIRKRGIQSCVLIKRGLTAT